MIFLRKEYLENFDSLKIKCSICWGDIKVNEGYGQSGFNYKIRYFCERCAEDQDYQKTVNSIGTHKE